MTKLLEKIFQKVSSLSPERQDELAAIFREEIKAQGKWDELLEKHPEVLENMVQEAQKEIKEGKTTPLEFKS